MNKNELQETHYDIEETIQYIDSCLRSTKHVTEAYKKKKKKYIIYIKEKGVLVKYQTPTVVTILLLLPHYQPLLLEILVSLYCGETGAYFFSSRALKNKSSTECTSNIKKFKYFIFCNHFAKVIPQVLSSVPIFFPILFDRKG